MGIALSLEDVAKTYPNGTVGLHPTTLDLSLGSFYGMVGPNGAGKSTLIHLAAGAIRPSTGKVTYNLPHRRSLAWVSQTTSIDWFLSARDNVLLGARLSGLRGIEARNHADACLTQVGLESKATALPDQLSGGQQRRLQVARALAQRPQVLLLDEPTTGLDPVASDELIKHLRALADAGACILMASHDLDRLDNVCDQVLWAADGHLELTPKPTNLSFQYQKTHAH
jgi:ABC-type multidrug transport system ATPase subunit